MTSDAKSSRFWAAAAAPLVGLLIGFLASVVQTTYAPVGVFPLLTGVAVGAPIGVFFRLSGGRGRAAPFVAATLAALTCLAALHYFTYLHEQAAADEKARESQKLRDSIVQRALGDGATGLSGLPVPPTTIGTFGEYMAMKWDVGQKLGPLTIRGVLLGMWWFLDGLLLWVGTAVAALVLGGTPPAPRPSTETPGVGP